MYRIILPTNNLEEAVSKHRPALKGHAFTRVSHKGAKKVVVLYDPDYKGEYSAPTPCAGLKGASIQVEKSLPELQRYLDAAVPDKQDRIPVRTASTVVLQIQPATAEPTAILFSTGEFGKPTTPYGRRALEFAEMYDRFAAAGEGTYALADWLDLVCMALKRSYPGVAEPFWDAAQLVSTADLEKLILAAVGIDAGFLDAGVPTSATPA